MGCPQINPAKYPLKEEGNSHSKLNSDSRADHKGSGSVKLPTVTQTTTEARQKGTLPTACQQLGPLRKRTRHQTVKNPELWELQHTFFIKLLLFRPENIAETSNAKEETQNSCHIEQAEEFDPIRMTRQKPQKRGLNETEITNLLDKDFKIKIINTLMELQKNIQVLRISRKRQEL